MAKADRETWAKRVERWKESGLSAAQFATEIGVSPKSLSWWRWRLTKGASEKVPRRRKSSKPALSPMTFIEMSAPPSTNLLEILLPSGVRVRVPTGADVATLGGVLEILEKRR